MNTGHTFPCSTPLQPYNHALHNTAVSPTLKHGDILPFRSVHLTLYIIFRQVPPAAANGQVEDHWEDIPHSVRGVTGPGRLQDPHHVNVVNHGMVVSNAIWYRAIVDQ